jgi:hypothetical protein
MSKCVTNERSTRDRKLREALALGEVDVDVSHSGLDFEAEVHGNVPLFGTQATVRVDCL